MLYYRKMKMNDIQKREDALFEHIAKLIETSREQVKTTIKEKSRILRIPP